VDLSDRIFTRLLEQAPHFTLGPPANFEALTKCTFSLLVVLNGQVGTKLRGVVEKLSQNRCRQSG